MRWARWVFLVLAILPLSSAVSEPGKEPLGIDWKMKTTLPIQIENYRYYFGDIAYGVVVYLSTEDNNYLSTESEIHLYYFDKKISKAMLIFGPRGINQHNCYKKYSTIVGLLNKKYKHYSHRKHTRDPISKDLFFVSPCKTVQQGLDELRTVWYHDEYKIIATLLGDDEGIYVEIEYIKVELEQNRIKNNLEKILKKL